MDKTPFEEIFLSSEEITLLKSFSDGEPQTFEADTEPVRKLINYGLVRHGFESGKYSFVQSKQVAITLRGTAYLKHLADKNHLLRLSEDSHTFNKKSYFLSKIILVVTIAGIIISVLIAIS